MKMKTTRVVETSIFRYQTSRIHIPEDRNVIDTSMLHRQHMAMSTSRIMQLDSSCITSCITVHMFISYVLQPTIVRSLEICKEGNKSGIVNTILIGKLIVAEPRTNLMLHSPKVHDESSALVSMARTAVFAAIGSCRFSLH
jgi:hypothetical protein